MAMDPGVADLLIERDAAMLADDGVRLASTVYRRPGAPPAPALLMRTPYGKDASPAIHVIDPAAAVRAGFVVIVQDVRGRHASQGVWRPYEADAADGAAAVRWAAALPFCDGKVGMYGASYQAAAALAAAAMRPPALMSIAPMMCWSDPQQGQTFRGGALELGKLLRWTLMNLPDRLAKRIADPAEARRLMDEVAADLAALDLEAYRALPLGRQPLLRKYDPASEFFDYIAAADAGDLQSPALAPPGRRHAVPALWIGAWYDAFIGNMVRDFQADREAGLTSELIVGPWTHASRARTVGDLDFGPLSEAVGEAQASMHDVLIDWFARTLQGRPTTAPTVQVFAMGANRWRSLRSFPPHDAEPVSLHLTAQGGLDLEAGEDGAVTFVYDPNDPAPSVGGASLMGAPFSAGPRDQAPVSARDDVLLFRTPVLEAPFEACGWVSARLWVETSAPCTDFVARLLDIDPAGRQIGVADGILRQAFDPAGGARMIVIDLWPTDYVFAAGHRLGLQVTSSAFPRWSRNPNTGEPLATAVQVRPARQTVHLGAARPSCLRLSRGPAAP